MVFPHQTWFSDTNTRFLGGILEGRFLAIEYLLTPRVKIKNPPLHPEPESKGRLFGTTGDSFKNEWQWWG
jgi:hypothetical protein